MGSIVRVWTTQTVDSAEETGMVRGRVEVKWTEQKWRGWQLFVGCSRRSTTTCKNSTDASLRTLHALHRFVIVWDIVDGLV